MTKLRAALIGCGVISPQHIQGFANSSERAALTAVCDLDSEKAETARKRYQTFMGREVPTKAVTDYELLLADPQIDAVDICLPHHLHEAVALAAAKAGKQILCEKPLSPTLEGCDRIIEGCKAAGVLLMHGENMRLYPVVVRAAEEIAAGNIGTVTGLQQTYAYWQPASMNEGWRGKLEEAGGGQLMDAAIHHVDVLRHLGGEMAALQAMTTQHRPELGALSEDTGVLNFRYRAGHLGQLFAGHGTRNRGASPLLTVFGDQGSLTLQAYGKNQALVWFPYQKEPQVLIETCSVQESFNAEIAHFVEAILDGVPLKCTPADGRANVQVILGAYESARTGCTVAL